MRKLYIISPITSLLALALTLSACAPLPQKSTPQPNTPVTAIEQSSASSSNKSGNPTNTPINSAAFKTDETITDYLDRMQNAAPEIQKRELSELTQVLQNNKQEIYTRTKLALLYGLPASKVKDSSKAISISEELLKENLIDSERRAVLTLMHDYLVEIAKTSLKLREEQRKQDTLQSKLENSQAKADVAQQRADDLQQKLDELKNIEKAMLKRSTTKPKSAP